MDGTGFDVLKQALVDTAKSPPMLDFVQHRVLPSQEKLLATLTEFAEAGMFSVSYVELCRLGREQVGNCVICCTYYTCVTD